MYHFFYPRLLRAQIYLLGTAPNRPGAKCLEVSFGLEGNVSPGTRFILHNYGLEVQTGKRLQPQIELLGKIGNHSQPQTHTCNSFNNGATTRL